MARRSKQSKRVRPKETKHKPDQGPPRWRGRWSRTMVDWALVIGKAGLLLVDALKDTVA